LPETRESLGKYQDFPRPKSNFLAQNLISLNRFPTFVNGFLLSSMAFCFPQPISNFSQWLSTFQEIQENLSKVTSIQKIAIQASYFPPLAL
jgi:hypothetical protein